MWIFKGFSSANTTAWPPLALLPLTLCGADCNRNIDFNANFSVENGNFIKSGKLMNDSSCTFNFSLRSGNATVDKINETNVLYTSNAIKVIADSVNHENSSGSSRCEGKRTL